MKCLDCDLEIVDQDDHWADCKEAPEYVRFQAKADRRYRNGGPFAPGRTSDRSLETPTSRHLCGCYVGGKDVTRNHIDRGEPIPQQVKCEAHRG